MGEMITQVIDAFYSRYPIKDRKVRVEYVVWNDHRNRPWQILTLLRSTRVRNFQQSLTLNATLIKRINILLYICPEPTCNASYIGETARRLDQRVKEYGGKDNNSYIFRHSVDAGLAMVESNNFKIIATGSKHTYTRKIAEALNIKRDKPSLNVSLLSFFKL